MGWFGSGNQDKHRVGITFSQKGYRDFSPIEADIASSIMGILKDEGYTQYGSTLRIENPHGVNPGLTERWRLMIQPSGDLVHFNTFAWFRKDGSSLALSFAPAKDNQNPDRTTFDRLITATQELMEQIEPGCKAETFSHKVEQAMLPMVSDYVNTGKGVKKK